MDRFTDKMKSNVKTEQFKRISREDVLRAAEVLFSKQGYQETSTRQIAAESGLKSGSIYHHFKSKEEILHALLRDFIGDTVPSYKKIVKESSDQRDAFKSMIEFSLRRASRQPHIANIAIVEWSFFENNNEFSYVEESWSDAREIWHDVLEKGAAEGLFRADLDLRIVVSTITALIASIARDHFRYKWSIDLLINTQTSILIRGLSPEMEK